MRVPHGFGRRFHRNDFDDLRRDGLDFERDPGRARCGIHEGRRLRISLRRPQGLHPQKDDALGFVRLDFEGLIVKDHIRNAIPRHPHEVYVVLRDHVAFQPVGHGTQNEQKEHCGSGESFHDAFLKTGLNIS